MPNTTPIVFGVVLATKFWLYFTAMVYLLPAGILVHYWWLHVATFFSLAVFYKACTSNPGLIHRSKNMQEVHRVCDD